MIVLPARNPRRLLEEIMKKLLLMMVLLVVAMGAMAYADNSKMSRSCTLYLRPRRHK